MNKKRRRSCAYLDSAKSPNYDLNNWRSIENRSGSRLRNYEEWYGGKREDCSRLSKSCFKFFNEETEICSSLFVKCDVTADYSFLKIRLCLKEKHFKNMFEVNWINIWLTNERRFVVRVFQNILHKHFLSLLHIVRKVVTIMRGI